MNLTQNKPYLPIILILCTLLCNSCNKATTIGNDLITDESLLQIIQDTLPIQLNAYIEDSIETAPLPTYTPLTIGSSVQYGSLQSYILGNLNDPFFGNANAGIYLQPQLIGQLAPQTDWVIDSVVLSIAYNPALKVYGDPNSTHHLTVYEATQYIAPDTTYYATQQIDYDPMPVGQKQNLQFAPTDSISILKYNASTNTTTLTQTAPQIRIPLNPEIGNRLLAATTDAAFLSNKNFIKFFKGLYVTCSKTGNSMASVSMLSNNSQLLIYYKRPNLAGQVINFPLTTSGAFCNKYKYNFSGTPIQSYLSNPSPNAQNVAYMQSLSGLATEITLPTLQNATEKIVVNKAELEFYAIMPNNDTTYAPPTQFSLWISNGNKASSLPISLTTAPPEKVTDNATGAIAYKYTMLISKYLQDKILNKYKEGVKEYLYVSPRKLSAQRAIIAGPNYTPNPNWSMKITLLYTKITE